MEQGYILVNKHCFVYFRKENREYEIYSRKLKYTTHFINDLCDNLKQLIKE